MYEHSQRAGPALLVLGLVGVALPVVVLAGNVPLTWGPRLTLVAAALVLLVSVVAFGSLTIRVADGQLQWWFGPRMLRKAVPLSEVAGAAPTTVGILDGWGIHFTSRGWLYNVAGRGAVLVTRRDGGRFLLGTDEPEALVAAIEDGKARS